MKSKEEKSWKYCRIWGTKRVDQVDGPDIFSVRGDIVDIYPINEIHPVRIEFFGDEIDSIRLFDVDSQRSIETLESQSVFPVAVKGSKNSSILLPGSWDRLL